MPQDYNTFLSTMADDRVAQKAYLEQLVQNDDRFKDLSIEQAGNVIADTTGLKRFNRFGGLSGAVDWLGFNSRQSFENFPALTYDEERGVHVEGASDAFRKNAVLGTNVLGADEATQKLAGDVASGVPNTLGTLGLAAIPVVGTGLMAGTAYAQGLDQAYSRDVSGVRAQTVGALSGGVSLLTMGLAKPLTNAISRPIVSRLAAKGAVAGLSDLGGKGAATVAFNQLMQSSAITGVQKSAAIVGRELAVNAAQSGIGIAGNLAQEYVIAPDQFLSTISNSEYWAPMLVSEGLFAVGATTMARARTPLPTSNDPSGSQPVASQPTRPGLPFRPSDVEMLNTPQRQINRVLTAYGVDPDLAPRFATAIHAEGGLDPATFQQQVVDRFHSLGGLIHRPSALQAENAKTYLDQGVPVQEATRLAELAKATNKQTTLDNEAGRMSARKTNEQLVNLFYESTPVFPVDAKIEQGVRPTDPKSDLKVVEASAGDAKVAARETAREQERLKKVSIGEATSDDTDAPVQKVEPTIGKSPQSMAEHWADGERSLRAGSDMGAHENGAQKAVGAQNVIVGDVPQKVSVPQSIAHAKQEMARMEAAGRRDAYFAQTDDRNYMAFRNPGNNMHGVLMHVVENDKVVSSNKLIIGPREMFEVAMFPREAQASLEATGDRKFRGAQFAELQKHAANVESQYQGLDVVTFGEGHSEGYSTDMRNMLDESGITDALRRVNGKLRFGPSKGAVNRATLDASPLDYFSSRQMASHEQVDMGERQYFHISKHANGDVVSDLHELGHTVHALIEKGGFGPEAQADWQKLLSEAAKVAGANPTDALAGARIMMETVGSQLPETYSIEGTRKYYLEQKEIAAQLYQGYMLGRKNKWTDFVNTHLPSLSQAFKRIMDSLRKRFNLKGEAAKSLYSPGMQEATVFFDGLFNGKYKADGVTNPRLRKLVNEQGLVGRAAEAVTESFGIRESDSAHTAVENAVKSWKDGLDGDPTDADMQDLVEQLGVLNMFNRSVIDGQASPGTAVQTLPWVTRLRKAMVNPESTLDEVVARVTDPKLKDRVEKMRNGRSQLVQRFQFLGRAVDEMLAFRGDQRVKAFEVAEQVLAVDNVVKRWMLGRLEGQNGIPFHDNWVAAHRLSNKDKAQITADRNWHEFFPIMSKAMQAEVTRYAKIPETHVAADGSFDLSGEKKERTVRTLKAFATREEADGYISALKADAQNYGVSFKSEPYVRKVKGQPTSTVYRIRAKRSLLFDNASSLVEGMKSEADIAADVEAMRTAEVMAAAAIEDSAMNEMRNNVIDDKGPMIVRDASEVIPMRLEQQFDTNVIPRELQVINEEFTRWTAENVENSHHFKGVARSFGLADDARPQDIAVAYVKGLFEQNKDFELAIQLAAKPVQDYVQSVANHARKLTQGYMRKSIDSFIDGQAPILDPNQDGVEAMLANNGPMSSRQVEDGTDAMLRQDPGTMASYALTDDGAYWKYRGKSVFGKSFDWMERFALAAAGNPVQMGMTDPRFRPMAEAIHKEQGSRNAYHMDTLSNLWTEGAMVQGQDGVSSFVRNPEGKVETKGAYLRVKDDAKMSQLYSDVTRVEQVNGKPFADVLNSADPLEKAMAQEVIRDTKPEDLQVIQDLLERRYAAHIADVTRSNEIRRGNRDLSFADVIMQNPNFKGSAQDAWDFTSRFRTLNETDQVLALQEAIGVPQTSAVDMMLKWQMIEERSAAYDQLMLQHKEFVNEHRNEDFQVKVRFKDGTRGHYGFAKANEAEAFIGQMKAEGNIVQNRPTNYFERKQNFKPMNSQLEEIITNVTQTRVELAELAMGRKLDPEGRAILNESLKGIAEEIKMENAAPYLDLKEFEKRRVVKGREQLDMLRQFEENVYKKGSALTRKHTDLVYRLFSRDSEVLADRARLDMMNEFREGLRIPDSNIQRNIGKWTFNMFMAGNMTTALIEMNQFPLSVSHILVENGAGIVDAFKIPAQMWKKANQAAIARLTKGDDSDIWTGEHSTLIREAELQGRLNVRKANDVDATSMEYGKSMKMLAGQNPLTAAASLPNAAFNWLGSAYGYFNRINAELSLVSAYETLKAVHVKEGGRLDAIDIRRLQDRAMQVAELANGSFGRVGRPSWFGGSRNKGLRTVGQMAWGLQSYSSAVMANTLRLFRKSFNVGGGFERGERVQARKALALGLGVNFLACGAMGLPFVGGLAKVVEKAFGFSLEDELRDFAEDKNIIDPADRLFLSDALSYGLLYASGFPADVQSRMAVSGIGPLNNFEGLSAQGLGGPLFGTATQMASNMAKINSGQSTPLRAAVDFLPNSLRRSVKMEFFDDGNVMDGSGNFVITPSTAERMLIYAGSTPLRYRQEMAARAASYEAMDSDRRKRSQRAAEINRALASEGAASAQRIIMQTAMEFGMDPDKVAQMAASQFVSRKLGPEPREGVGPAAMRAQRLYPSPSASPTAQQERLMSKITQMSNLGFSMPNSARAMQRAAAMDSAMVANPLMTSGMARRYIASPINQTPMLSVPSVGTAWQNLGQ